MKKYKFKNGNEVWPIPEPHSWEFVEDFYPNYHTSDDILMEDQLHQVLYDNISIAELNRKNDTSYKNIGQVGKDHDKLQADIYNRAYLAFIQKIITGEIEIIND